MDQDLNEGRSESVWNTSKPVSEFASAE